MATAMIESRQMGRPKKEVGTTSIRISVDAQQLARKACGFTNESLVEYVTRVVLEQAQRDLDAGVEEYRASRKTDRRTDR